MKLSLLYVKRKKRMARNLQKKLKLYAVNVNVTVPSTSKRMAGQSTCTMPT